MNPIQKDILTKLIQSISPLSFSHMLPDTLKLESDRFNYHLKQLVQKGFIKKEQNEYKLTERGLKLTSDFTAKGQTFDKFKVSVALCIIRKVDNKKSSRVILVQKRLRHPFYGDKNTISGKVERGEEIIQTATRKLKEETGLIADFKYVGTLRNCKKDENGNILEDTFYYYCYTENPKGKLQGSNEYGENFWVPTNEFIGIIKNSEDVAKMDIQVFERLLNGNFDLFFFEQFKVIKNYTRRNY